MRQIQGPAPYVYTAFPQEHLIRIKAKLDEIGGLAYHFDEFTDRPEWQTVQITKLEATKFHGVEALRELDGMTIAQTMAIGDGPNDLPLFENAGLKIAMGNARDGLKAQADHIVGTIDQDGFAEAINRFVLK